MFNRRLGVAEVIAIDTAQSSDEFLSPIHAKKNGNKGCMENPLEKIYVETKHFGFQQFSRGPSAVGKSLRWKSISTQA